MATRKSTVKQLPPSSCNIQVNRVAVAVEIILGREGLRAVAGYDDGSTVAVALVTAASGYMALVCVC